MATKTTKTRKPAAKKATAKKAPRKSPAVKAADALVADVTHEDLGVAPTMNKVYALASRGDGNAQAALARMTPVEREMIAPPSLKGIALARFIKGGLTYRQQLLEAQGAREAEELAAEQPVKITRKNRNRKSTTDTEENTVKTTARKTKTNRKSTNNTKEAPVARTAKKSTKKAVTTKRSRKADAGSTTRSKARAAQAPAEGITAATVARDNELDARKFRAFLRAEGIDRTFATRKAATAAVRAFRKATK